ncbi:MAG: HDOD domain-containing protein [Polyangiaceae bacterium]
MASLQRVLLVDDEPQSVAALERVVGPLRTKWEARSETSPTAALALLQTEAFDVVISDMRMPEMDGAAFLAQVKTLHPGALRVILSGQSERSAAQRAASIAHQFLPKPFPPRALVELLERRGRVTSSGPVRQLVGGIDALPSTAGTLDRLEALVREAHPSVEALTALVESEPALTLKLLQLTGSSFFGVRRHIDDVRDAVAFSVPALFEALLASARAANARSPEAKELDFEGFRTRAVDVAASARKLAGESPHAGACFIAGLLHEIGKLVLAVEAPSVFDAVANKAREEQMTFEQAEEATGAAPFAHVGAALLDSGGFPQSIVEAVARQNDAHYEADYLDPTTAVRRARGRRIAPPSKPRALSVPPA